MRRSGKERARAAEVWSSNVKDGGAGVSPALARWVEEKVVPSRAFVSEGKAWCSRCGQPFSTDKKRGRVTCPHCKTRLEVAREKCSKKAEALFVQELTAWGELQVVRTYIADAWYKKKKGLCVRIWHAYDWLVFENGNSYCFSRRTTIYPQFRRIPFSVWDVEGRAPMTYKESAESSTWNRGWRISGHYPGRKVQPWLKRYGVGGRFMDFDLYDLIVGLVRGKPHLETVWKMRSEELCTACLYDGRFQMIWPQVKIALRHGFKMKDWMMWRDHVRMLEDEGFDIFSPKYIAPENLKAAHKELCALRERRLNREEEERRRQREEEESAEREALTDPASLQNAEYKERVGKVLAVVVRLGDIEIRPLQDIKDFYEEGRELHHCVYANKYYEEKESLILGARVGGVRTETIELNLRTMEIEQCRGKYNQDSERHREIYSLMRSSVERFSSMRISQI